MCIVQKEKIILCLKYLWVYVTPWIGNHSEEKSYMFSEISGMAILVTIVCWKYNTGEGGGLMMMT
jgi:hypothetical protein